ncbi:MAG TPA: hypothetical protein ENH02_01740, partial [Bacteroidetes bacterium]|nr:hypothetical protein [Bacteroidota bacterium]
VKKEKKGAHQGHYEDFLMEELEEMLKKAVGDENYEEASRLRDEINKRKKKNS